MTIIRSSSNKDSLRTTSMATIHPLFQTIEPVKGSHSHLLHPSSESMITTKNSNQSSIEEQQPGKALLQGRFPKPAIVEKAPQVLEMLQPRRTTTRTPRDTEIARLERMIRQLQLENLEQMHTISQQQSQLGAANAKITSLTTTLQEQSTSMDQLVEKNLNLILDNEASKERIAHLEGTTTTTTLMVVHQQADAFLPSTHVIPTKISDATDETNIFWNEGLTHAMNESTTTATTKNFDEWSYSSNNSVESLTFIEAIELGANQQQKHHDDDTQQVQEHVESILLTNDKASSLLLHAEVPPQLFFSSPTSGLERLFVDDEAENVLGLQFLSDDSTTSILVDNNNVPRRRPKAA